MKTQSPQYQADLKILANYKGCNLEEIERRLVSLKTRRKLPISLTRLASILANAAMRAVYNLPEL